MSIARLLNPNGKISSQFLPQTQAPILGAADPENIGENEVGFSIEDIPEDTPLVPLQPTVLAQVDLPHGVWWVTGTVNFTSPNGAAQSLRGGQCSLGFADTGMSPPPYSSTIFNEPIDAGNLAISVTASQVIVLPVGGGRTVYLTALATLTNSSVDPNTASATAILQAVRLA